MGKKFTFYAGIFVRAALVFSALVINSFTAKIYAQDCTNSAVIHSEDFGVGVVPVTNPDVWSFVFQAAGPLTQGQYRVVNNTQQNPGWHASADHTANDVDGRMLVAEGQGVTFYQIFVTRETGFFPGDYSVSLSAMNLDPLGGTCEANAKLPAIMFEVDYLSEDGLYVESGPYVAPPLEQTVDPIWVNISATFNVPPTGNFLVKTLKLWMADATFGGPGCGNDFAVDDIILSQCAIADPTPVTFLSINALQKGSGVSVEWSTSQELNNKSFVVEKSDNGNSNWSVVASINAAGNSSTVKNYNVYDPQPFKGVNYYRIRQVDIDGHFKYSKTISIKLNTIKTGVSVIANPFHNLLTVDFLSSTNQVVSARLVDITGKQVAAEKWSINSGSTRKDFSNVSRLQSGMYILTVSGANGEIFYNGKVVKQ